MRGVGGYIKIEDKKVCDIEERYSVNIEQLEADLERFEIPYEDLSNIKKVKIRADEKQKIDKMTGKK